MAMRLRIGGGALPAIISAYQRTCLVSRGLVCLRPPLIRVGHLFCSLFRICSATGRYSMVSNVVYRIYHMDSIV